MHLSSLWPNTGLFQVCSCLSCTGVGTELDAVLQEQPHQCQKEGMNHVSRLAMFCPML